MKIVLIIAFMSTSFCSAAQTKDSTAKDTVAVLSYQQAATIISFMQLQAQGNVDVKKETWAELMQMISKSLRVIPKKEQPK